LSAESGSTKCICSRLIPAVIQPAQASRNHLNRANCGNGVTQIQATAWHQKNEGMLVCIV
jgi:hypothetical protein